ncbi:MAG: Na+/H+ antiporter subunit E [bacterium]|nr:Na+/H+ antiporter subunit E [bacterium]
MRLSTFVFAVPMAVLWMGLTSRTTLESFGVGYLLSAAILLARPPRLRLNVARLPGQLWALFVYALILFRDIVLSGIDVARRVLSPDMRLKLGIITVPTGDTRKSPFVAALSADVITLTPGELVVEIEGDDTLYVHCLDAEASARTADQVQARRLALLLRIMGRETDE